VLQGWWTDEFGPTGTANDGIYAGKSYWLCTENWPDQNYPVDLSVYYKSGGFSNGYVPLFIVVGFQNKVYWNSNSSAFGSALRQAINEMPTEGVYVSNPFEDKTFLFEGEGQFDVSEVFRDMNDNPVTVSVQNISNPLIATASVKDNIITITANSSLEGTTEITLLGTAGEYSDTDTFTVTIYDTANYKVEDFETGGFNYIPWTFSGNAGWSIDTLSPYEGIYCAKSNDITHSQSAEILVEVEYSINGKVHFSAKASSEVNYDYLKFFIDRYEKKKISGQTSWQDAVFDVTAGTHVFKWSYQKDSSGDAYNDCGYIDYIIFEGGRVTGIENVIVPSEVNLFQNYPNPFNPETSINFEIPENGNVKLSVFNHKGELVKNIFEGALDRGFHSYKFYGSDLTSGIYFYRLEVQGQVSMKKMILLK